jgi:hypothetical protein
LLTGELASPINPLRNRRRRWYGWVSRYRSSSQSFHKSSISEMEKPTDSRAKASRRLRRYLLLVDQCCASSYPGEFRDPYQDGCALGVPGVSKDGNPMKILHCARLEPSPAIGSSESMRMQSVTRRDHWGLHIMELIPSACPFQGSSD